MFKLKEKLCHKQLGTLFLLKELKRVTDQTAHQFDAANYTTVYRFFFYIFVIFQGVGSLVPAVKV